MNKKTKKENAQSLVEGVSESTTACLLAMVQGNVLALTVGHLAIAAQTGVLAGSLALAITLIARIDKPWVMPVLLALCTAVIDYYVHDGMFGGEFTEAIVTGVTAGILSYAVSRLFRWRRSTQRNTSA